MKKILIVILLAAAALLSSKSSARIKVVTSTTDLAYFTNAIGGDLVEVTSIASPTADLHFVEPRPSYMVKTRDADLVLKVGLELDMWMNGIVDGSRNNHAKIVDCSKYVKPLEVPSFKADASYGDLHRFGNPHYWLSPDNVAPITEAIAEGLADADPQNAAVYEKNRRDLLDKIDSQLATVREEALPLKGAEIVTYHNSWPYFAEYFGIELPMFVEKYPGVAPSPSQIKELTDLIRKRGIKVIAVEPYFDKRVPEKIARETGAKVVTLYPSIGGRHDHESYLDWLRGNVEALTGALK